MNNAGQIKS